MGHLHTHKVYHKDIKPENVLVSAQGHVTLIDFNVSEKFKEKSSPYILKYQEALDEDRNELIEGMKQLDQIVKEMETVQNADYRINDFKVE